MMEILTHVQLTSQPFFLTNLYNKLSHDKTAIWIIASVAIQLDN